MGVRFPSVQSNTIVNVNFASSENVICTTPPLNIPLDFATVLLFWYLTMTSGTGTTNITPLIRRGTGITGTIINGNTNDNTTAGNTTRRSGVYFDTPGAVAGQQYSLTMTQIGASANGTILDVCLIAFAL